MGGQRGTPTVLRVHASRRLHKLPPLEGRHAYLTMHAAAFPGPHKAV